MGPYGKLTLSFEGGCRMSEALTKYLLSALTMAVTSLVALASSLSGYLVSASLILATTRDMLF